MSYSQQSKLLQRLLPTKVHMQWSFSTIHTFTLQVKTCNFYYRILHAMRWGDTQPCTMPRVLTNSHHTRVLTYSYYTMPMLHLNDHLYSKPCVFLWVENFQGLTIGFIRLPTLSRAFTVGHISITKNNKAFTRRGIYPYFLLPDTYFHFHV